MLTAQEPSMFTTLLATKKGIPVMSLIDLLVKKRESATQDVIY